MKTSTVAEPAASLAGVADQTSLSEEEIIELTHPRHILVPIDFSQNALNGLGYAAAFAERIGARLSLIHIAQPTVWPLDCVESQPSIVSMVADAGERLADLARDFGRKISSGPIGVNVRVGDPTTEVGQEAHACGADLIIMSTHGYTGLKRVLFGGITDSVVRCSPCPVLVVRSHPPENASHRSSPAHELRRLLVPMDFSLRAERAIRYAVALAEQAGSAVSLVHVMPDIKQNDAAVLTGGHPTVSADAGKQLHSVMDDVVHSDLRGEVYLRCGAPFQHIITVADSHDVDLLVLTTHGRTGLSHLLMGSTAERVMYHASCPVLIIRTA